MRFWRHRQSVQVSVNGPFALTQRLRGWTIRRPLKVGLRPVRSVEPSQLSDCCAAVAEVQKRQPNFRYRRRIQPVDATVWLNISAGVW